jgi:hypothetical protein
MAAGSPNLGQIVGLYGFIPDSTTGLVQDLGFIRDTDGTITTFAGPLPPGSIQANGISSTGVIVGSFSRNPENAAPNVGIIRSCILCP